MFEKGVLMKFFVVKQMKREQDGINYIRISFMEFFTCQMFFG